MKPEADITFMQDDPVVVFGGAGFIGTHLISRLRQITKGPIVSIDIRQPKRPVPRVEYRIQDIRDLSTLKMDRTVPVVFNLAAIHTTPGHKPWEYYDANVGGAIEVCRFASRHNTKQILFTSSISVYGPDETQKDEFSKANPTSDYGRSKLLAEKVHLDWLEHDDSRKLVITRPAVVFGHGEGGNFTRLAKLLDMGFFMYPGRRDTIKSCISVDYLIQCILAAAVHQEKYILFNGVFLERYTIEDIVEAFRKVAFSEAKTVTFPAYFMKLAAMIMRPLSATGLGIHPDRIEKLMVSTNIYSKWIASGGCGDHEKLEQSLRNWMQQGGGKFL